MSKYYLLGLTLVFGVFLSCTPKDNGAQERLNAARELYMQGRYEEAAAEIDSISKIYPKAIDVRKQGVALLDSVRRGDNVRIIQVCDSIVLHNQPIVDSMKKLFVYDRNKEYQETGYYLPKETATKGSLTHTTLRSGVAENGVLFLESVFIGAQKHNRIKVSVKNGETIESESVVDDGLNYSFSNLGKTYEVVRFVGDAENGIAKMIEENVDKNITVALEGKNKTTFTLSNVLKTAISKSYRLSQVMLESDSMLRMKEHAEFKIRYLENKDEVIAIKKNLEDQGGKMKNVD